MDDLHAMLLLRELKHLGDYLQRRQENANYYNRYLETVQIPVIPEGRRQNWNYSPVLIPANFERDEIKQHLLAAGIETAVYYPRNVRLLIDFQVHDQELDFLNAGIIASRVLCLPVHPQLSPRDLEHVTREVNRLR